MTRRTALEGPRTRPRPDCDVCGGTGTDDTFGTECTMCHPDETIVEWAHRNLIGADRPAASAIVWRPNTRRTGATPEWLYHHHRRRIMRRAGRNQ